VLDELLKRIPWEASEKPLERGEKGWGVNPLGGKSTPDFAAPYPEKKKMRKKQGASATVRSKEKIVVKKGDLDPP